MKIGARVLVVLASVLIAYLVMLLAQSFTGVPLGNGHMEATPATLAAIFWVFPITLIGTLVIGNILLNRWFRARNAK